MQVFISYRRKTWAFTHRLAERLREKLRTQVFVDVDSVDEAVFENSILRNLRQSDVFLLVVSPETFDPQRIHREDDWVRREIAEALSHDLTIVLALVDGTPPPPPQDLPPDIRDVVRWQGIEFYPRFFDAGVDELAQFIRQAAGAPQNTFPLRSPAIIAFIGVIVLLGALWLAGVIGPGRTPKDEAVGEVTAQPTETTQSATPTQAEQPTPTVAPTPLVTPTTRPRTIIMDDNVEQVTRVRTLQGHTDSVWGLEWALDGERLVSGSADRKTILWDSTTGQRLLTVEGSTGAIPVYDADFSPDGTAFATGAINGALIVWDAETGQPVQRLGGVILAWSRDGTTLAASTLEDEISLWDVETGSLIRTLEGPTEFIESIEYSPDGKLIASGGQDRTVRVWDTESGDSVLRLPGHGDEVNSVAWSPEGTMLAAGARDGKVYVWHVPSGLLLRTLEGHTFSVEGVAWSPNGQLLLSGSLDGTAILWQTETGVQLRVLEGHPQGVFSVAWSPDGTKLGLGLQDGSVTVWEVSP